MCQEMSVKLLIAMVIKEVWNLQVFFRFYVIILLFVARSADNDGVAKVLSINAGCRRRLGAQKLSAFFTCPGIAWTKFSE